MAELVAGAVLGAIVGELLKDVIFLAKVASRCKRNCKNLLVTLDSISPLLDDVAKSTMIENVSCQAWLKNIHDLLMDAKIIAETCSVKKWSDRINYIKRTKLSAKIIAIDNQIRMKLLESNLITLCIVQAMENQSRLQPSTISSRVQSIPNTKVQDIPSMTVPFMANPFEKLKNKIVNGGNRMDVSMTIGLKGRGGCGKTLLAKMVNNDKDIQKVYEGSGGILWITIGRDATIPSLYLTIAKLLNDEVYIREYMHRNLEDQRGYLIQSLQTKKVLLILDDVWDHYPANNRAMVEWLDVNKGPGSITLITTREISVLKCVKCVDMVDVQSLSKEDSWELFCMHAFVNKKPPSIIIGKIAKDICEQCDGLPLAIKVIGSAMWEKIDEREWHNTLNYLEGTTRTPHSKFVEKEVEKKLYNHLQYSYDELDDTSKKCFLHFAAFPEDDQISSSNLCDIWQAQQIFGSTTTQETRDVGISVLIDLADRSLIDMSEDGKFVQIHDVLRDLANHILSKAKPDEWASQCYFQVRKAFKTFPSIGKHVKVVSLIGCSFQEFPNNLELPNLQVFLLAMISNDKTGAKLAIPKSFFSSMKDLQLLSMHNSIGVECNLINFEQLTSLMHLDLSFCRSLSKLPENIKELKSLRHLDLRECSSLVEIPKGIKELKSLTHLYLQGCSSCIQLPEGIKEMESLIHLDLRRFSSLTELPKGIKELKSLVYLDLSGCSSLTELPEGIKELKSLTHLYLRGCSSLTQFPESIKELKSLIHLDLSWCSSLTILPKNIKELKSLKHFNISWCSSLMEFLENIKELKSLIYFNFRGCSSLTKLPKDIKELNFLTQLDFTFYSSLTELPEDIKDLKSLTHLNLRWCSSLMELPEGIKELKSLTHLDLSWCSSLTKLPKSIKELKLLMHLYLRGCSSLAKLPESIKDLKFLTYLDLRRCSSLKELPEGIKELKFLKDLNLEGCSSLMELPESIEELKSLTSLNLSRCLSLIELPKGIKGLKSLTHLYLQGCLSLTKLPESIEELKCLTYLDLSSCSSLMELPKNIKEMKSLKYLS